MTTETYTEQAETYISELRTSYNALCRKLAARDATITQLNEQLAAAQAQVAELSATVEQLQAQINKLRAGVDGRAASAALDDLIVWGEFG